MQEVLAKCSTPYGIEACNSWRATFNKIIIMPSAQRLTASKHVTERIHAERRTAHVDGAQRLTASKHVTGSSKTGNRSKGFCAQRLTASKHVTGVSHGTPGNIRISGNPFQATSLVIASTSFSLNFPLFKINHTKF